MNSISIPPLDRTAMAKARDRHRRLTKPPGSLGRLEELGIWLAGVTGRCPPPVPMRKAVLVFAADHGVAAHGISIAPPEVTRLMTLNFAASGAAINVLCHQVGARMQVVDVGILTDLPPQRRLLMSKIRRGTADLSEGPAMTRKEAREALRIGASCVEQEIEAGLDLLALGEMGIGNTTPATAMICALTGGSPREVAGPGTGIGKDRLEKKIALLEKSLAVNQPDPSDPLDVLTKVGGLEIAAMAGAMRRAAEARVPVVLDGFIAGAAALAAVGMDPAVRDYLAAGHRSAEPGHERVLCHLGMKPLLDLDMRLGEGTGAALAMPILEAAARILSEMATFEEAGIPL